MTVKWTWKLQSRSASLSESGQPFYMPRTEVLTTPYVPNGPDRLGPQQKTVCERGKLIENVSFPCDTLKLKFRMSVSHVILENEIRVEPPFSRKMSLMKQSF